MDPPQLTFGPRRSPIRVARSVGAGACLAGAGSMLFLGVTAGEGVFYLWFFGLMALCAATLGVWFIGQGGRIAKLHASVSSEALSLTAYAGRHLWFERGLAKVTIPWVDIQGLTALRTLNMAVKGGVMTSYVLYTKSGDFTLNDLQWEDLAGLVREISARTGRAVGDVATERAAARNAVQTGVRRLWSLQRVFGWIAVIAALPLALLVLVAGLARGFSAELMGAFSFLMAASILGIAMIRFYRK